MRAWQPTATRYTAPMFQSIVLRLRWSSCVCVIIIYQLVWSKSLKSHRLINLVVERSRKSTECLSSRHTGKDGANVTFSPKTISFASTISHSEGYYKEKEKPENLNVHSGKPTLTDYLCHGASQRLSCQGAALYNRNWRSLGDDVRELFSKLILSCPTR